MPKPIPFPIRGTAPPAPRRKHPTLRIVVVTAASLLGLVVVGGIAGVLWLRAAAIASLPLMDGSLRLPGLSAPVIVRRDAHGVPHIDAATQDDLFEAQGYVTAQDRLWQMDLYRRNADGNLAEIMGPPLLEHDKIQRVLQIRLAAQRVFAHLAPADRKRLDDYTRGVNLYIQQCEQSHSLPVEFKLLIYRPQPWTGVDTVSVGMMEVQELDTHAANKLTRSWISARLHDSLLEADLYPVGSWRDHPPTGVDVDLTKPQPTPPPIPQTDPSQTSPGKTTPAETKIAPSISPIPPARPLDAATREALEALGMNDCGGCALGSNNWVISGAHTISGKPLLANDMHIALTEPNIWYMAALRAPGFDAAGVTLPGIPFIIAGHNEHIAWGFTDLYADVQDLYVERLDGKGHYLAADGQWKPLTLDREVIRVRLGRNVTVVVRSTDHGPLVNPILPKEKRPIALKWTLYDPSLNDIPLYAMNTASNWTEFSRAIADWSWPTQNLVYSDDQGHIAYHAIGHVPLRPGGLMGVPITDNRHEWAGYIPFDGMPNAFDPPSGFLATANSRVTTPQSPYPITLEWIDPYRIDRIYRVLDGRNHLAPQDMLSVQSDIYSEIDQEFAQRFAYAIDHTPNVDARLRQAADLMRGWDGKLDIDSAAPSIVDHARRTLWPLILKPKLGDLWTDYHWGESLFALEQIVMNIEARWLPPGYKDWNALLTEAVRKGLENAKAPANLARWDYGDWHVIDVENPLARFLPFVGRIAGTGPQPMSGDTTTVKQVSPFIGPSQRFTMDWSNIDGSTENIVMGESSDPLSPYFRDQWNDWYHGATFSLPFTPAAVAAQTTHTLRLLP